MHQHIVPELSGRTLSTSFRGAAEVECRGDGSHHNILWSTAAGTLQIESIGRFIRNDVLMVIRPLGCLMSGTMC